MKKPALLVMVLLLISFEALAANYGMLRVYAPLGRYQIYVDNDKYEPDPFDWGRIRLKEGRHEVVVKNRRGKEVMRKTIEVRKNKTSRIQVNAKDVSK